MDRIKLEILGLSHSQGQLGSYIVVLAEEGTNLKIPVVLDVKESTEVISELANNPNKGSIDDTLDLFGNVMISFNFKVTDIYIDKVVEGRFSSIITFEDTNGFTKEFNTSISNALVLSSKLDIPIYTNREVSNLTGFVVDDEGTPKGSKEKVNRSSMTTVDDLKKSLEDAISNENYEKAASLRDRIEQIESD